MKSATLNSQPETKSRLEDNSSPESYAYANDEWEEGAGAQPRSDYDYDASKEPPNTEIEIDEDGKADTMGPGSNEDWANWMSEKQIRTAYRDLCSVKSALESSANSLQAENLALTSQLLQVNTELRNENRALNRQLLQASMELQRMKSFMVVAGEKLLKTGGGATSEQKN